MNILLRDGDVLEVPPFDDIYASDMVGGNGGEEHVSLSPCRSQRRKGLRMSTSAMKIALQVTREGRGMKCVGIVVMVT